HQRLQRRHGGQSEPAQGRGGELPLVEQCSGGIANTEWDTHDHGTHVAGTVAGDNFANLLLHNTADGMAPGAKLVVQDGGFQTDNCGDLPGIGCPVVELNPIFQQAYTQGAGRRSASVSRPRNASTASLVEAAVDDVRIVQQP
ncbi:MAG TPA: S8 family serine peptidase, partial [Thermoanaerobaculia bacterium]|nr:S8 family serine peptidase [Thermoanaerobaculia bacterium]